MHRGAEEKAGVGPEHHEAVRLTARPKGIAAADLTSAQQDQLRSLLGVYLRRVPDPLAERERAEFAGDRLGRVHVAWAGGTERRQLHYHRLQGPVSSSSTTTPSAT